MPLGESLWWSVSELLERNGQAGGREGLNNTAWECVFGSNDYTLSSMDPSLE